MQRRRQLDSEATLQCLQPKRRGESGGRGHFVSQLRRQVLPAVDAALEVSGTLTAWAQFDEFVYSRAEVYCQIIH